MEKKILRFFDTEIVSRSESEESMSVEGYALKFDTWTEIGSQKWGWKERISRTALDKADTSSAVFNFNHDMSSLLAGRKNNTLQLIVDDIGLRIKADIIPTALGRDVYEMIKAGLINRMSFAATIVSDTWDDGYEEGWDLRTINSFGKLYDVSAVTFPAYDDTPLAIARSAYEGDEIYQRQLQKIKIIIGGIKHV